jgi:hypothetical protein
MNHIQCYAGASTCKGDFIYSRSKENTPWKGKCYAYCERHWRQCLNYISFGPDIITEEEFISFRVLQELSSMQCDFTELKDGFLMRCRERAFAGFRMKITTWFGTLIRCKQHAMHPQDADMISLDEFMAEKILES